jgi:hypothetical protein
MAGTGAEFDDMLTCLQGHMGDQFSATLQQSRTKPIVVARLRCIEMLQTLSVGRRRWHAAQQLPHGTEFRANHTAANAAI